MNHKQLRGKTPRVGETSTVCCLSNEAKSTMKKNYKNAVLQSLSLAISLVSPSFCVKKGYLYMFN